MSQENQDVNREQQRVQNKRQTNMAYWVIVGIIIIALLVSYIVMNALHGFVLSDFIKDILGNLMGVFAAFLIFDVAHDKMTKDTYADEVSEQLLATLLSKEDGMKALNKNVRRKFIGNALKSLDRDPQSAENITKAIENYLDERDAVEKVTDAIEILSNEQKRNFINLNAKLIVKDDDVFDMVSNFFDHYLIEKNECRIRKNFNYSIELRNTLPSVFNDLIHKDDYFYVQEVVSYDIKYLSPEMSNVKSDIVRLGFAYDNKSLDLLMREKQREAVGDTLSNCIFRETLDIDIEDIEYFKSLPQEMLKEQFVKMFRPHLTIDRARGECIKAVATDIGIVLDFKVNHDQDALEHTVDIIFHMPKRWGGALEIVLVDPTKEPKISLSYQEDTMYVEMLSYLDKGEAASYINAHENENGIYRILINDEWVYPISGVVFTINKNLNP